MKMHLALLGETSAAREIERVRVIREAVGEDIELMCDINQRWDVRQAISLGRRIEQYHLSWLEDIIAHDDYAGIARVAAALDTPLAAGEYVYGVTPFRHLLEAGAVDIVMIDLLRAGGISEWLKIASLAAAFNLPVVSHVLPEIHVHLIAATPHGLTVEYMPWTLALFEDVPRPVGGELLVPTKPGLGLSFDRETIKRYGV
jgi:L-alanine-DL-glutamate epimerase-like enolase superfamily enzyme